MKGRAPTAAEKRYHDRIASIGCIACKIDSIENDQVSVHHVEGRTRPGAHMKVLPLCFFHHMPNGAGVESVHGNKARFEAKYGTQAELMEMCWDILG